MVGLLRRGWGGEDGLDARMVSDTRMVSTEDGLVTRTVSDTRMVSAEDG